MNGNSTCPRVLKSAFFVLMYLGMLQLSYAQQLTQTITFPRVDPKVYGATFTLGATASSGLGIRYVSNNPAIASISGSTVTVTGIGEVWITAHQDGNDTYRPAAPITITLLTQKADQTINFLLNTVVDKFVDDPNFTLTATASSGLPVTFTSSDEAVATVTGNIVDIKKNGLTTIMADQAGNEYYNRATTQLRDIRVAQRIQTVTFPIIPTKSMGDADFDPGATASSGLAITYSSSNTAVATIVANKVHIVSTGTAIITAKQAGNTVYVENSAARTLTVGRRQQTITFAELPSKNFGDADFALTATASSGNTVTFESSNTSVATISGNTLHIVAPGTTSITARVAGDASYEAAAVVRSLEILKRKQTVTFAAIANKNMGDADFALNATASSGLAIVYTSSNTSVATIVSGNNVHIVGTGAVTITASQAGNGSYEAASQTQTFTITKKDQTITFNALAEKTAGDPDFTLSATASSGLAVVFTSSNTNVATIVNNNTVHIVGAGTTTITARQDGNTIYGSASREQTLVVTKAAGQTAQTITFAELATVPLDNGPVILNATASSGLAVSYTSTEPAVATVSGNRVTLVAPGRTTITASQAGNATYAPAGSVSRSLTVLATIVGIEHQTGGVVSIYPNPTTDRVKVAATRFTQKAPVSIALIDAYGRVVAREELHTNADNEIDFSIATLNEGVYILSITQGKFEFRDRIIKLR